MLKRKKLTPMPLPSGENNSRSKALLSASGKRLMSRALPPVRENPNPSTGWKTC